MMTTMMMMMMTTTMVVVVVVVVVMMMIMWVVVTMVNCECDDDHENTIRYRYINLKVFYLRQPFHARQLSHLHFLKHYKKHCKILKTSNS